MPKNHASAVKFSGQELPTHLTAGQVNLLPFTQADVTSMQLTSSGALEITLRGNSHYVIENFEQLAKSSQSGGRDTIIQLSDNSIIYPTDLYAKLSQSPSQDLLGEQGKNNVVDFKTGKEGALTIQQPKAHENVSVNVEHGQAYKFAFDIKNVEAARNGEDLILSFSNGGSIILGHFFAAVGEGIPPVLTLENGAVVDSSTFLTAIGPIKPYTADLAQQAAQVQPAAGDQTAAQKLANVEPAAGDAGAAPVSSSRGYGFASSIDSAALDGVTAIGAIGPTALSYSAPQIPTIPYVTGTDSAAATIIPPLDPVPVFDVIDALRIDETNMPQAGSISGQATVDYGTDAPGTVSASGIFTSGGSRANGALSSEGHAVTVSENGGVYTGTANGQTIFTFTINPDGTYQYQQFKPLDHADGTNANDVITLNFGIAATDVDGDTTNASVQVSVLDDAPTIAQTSVNIDESFFPTQNSVSGAITSSAGFDGLRNFSTINGGFTATGSIETGALRSRGNLVTVSLSGDTYTGTANGETVFTLKLNSDGTFNYQQLKALDHADRTDPNDIITLGFGYRILDGDGDSQTGTIHVNVYDDGPVIVTSATSSSVSASSSSASDSTAHAISVATSDTDTSSTSGSSSISSAASSISLASVGLSATSDTQQSTSADMSSDTSVSGFSLLAAPALAAALPPVFVDHGVFEAVPFVTTGRINVNFGTDGQGTFIVTPNSFNFSGAAKDGALTSAGQPVIVTQNGNSAVGMVGTETAFTFVLNQDGTYEFESFLPLDHVDPTTALEYINVSFDYTATDADGDFVGGALTFNVFDSAPTLVNDVVTVGSDPLTITGNALANDTIGADGGQITKITFNGTDTDLPSSGPTTIAGDFGTIIISPNGDYSYTSANTALGTDTFTYTVVDGDGDTKTADIIVTVNDLDSVPVVPGAADQTIDETDLVTTDSVSGTVTVNFGADSGSLAANNAFSSGGSKLGNA
ncbi:MAG: hypothetical protein JNK24_03800, partial [Alphaproteobacteria bacterium]|nr:hypothetical protein [Alphaproteobacteria bacterium]